MKKSVSRASKCSIKCNTLWNATSAQNLVQMERAISSEELFIPVSLIYATFSIHFQGVILKVHFQYCLHQKSEGWSEGNGIMFHTIALRPSKTTVITKSSAHCFTFAETIWPDVRDYRCTMLCAKACLLFYSIHCGSLHSVVKITAFKIESLWHAPTVLAHCGCVLYVVTVYMTNRNVLSCMHTHCCTYNQVDLPLHSWTLL